MVKRKFSVAALSAAMAVLLLAGCGQTNDANLEAGQPVQGSQNVQQENVKQENTEKPQDKEEEDTFSVQELFAGDGDLPAVYMSTEISAESLMLYHFS